MNDKYEERLGTDRMLPLVFRMALPAVIAQIVNLLYNIVDRVYIGHIPGIGTQALAGIGVAGSLIILISAFSAIVAGGGAPLAAIALGQGNLTCRKNIGERFCAIITFYAPDICLILSFYGADTFVYRCVQSDSRICYGLSFDLLDRYFVCRGFCRTEYLY